MLSLSKSVQSHQQTKAKCIHFVSGFATKTNVSLSPKLKRKFLMFMVGIIKFSSQIKKCCAQTVADLEREKESNGGGCSFGSAREG